MKRVLTLILLTLITCYAIYAVSTHCGWKIFSQTINIKQFDSIAQSNDDFIGMNIDDALNLVTKNNKCYVFSQESLCMGMSYDEIVAIYPEMELTPPRYKLYCVAVSSSMASEEIYPRGFFVNMENQIIEPPIALSIYW